MEFVSWKDEDFQRFLGKLQEDRFSLRPKHEKLLTEIFSKKCEQAIVQILKSSDLNILKETVFKNKTVMYRFKEFDFHLPELKVIGEIKASFSSPFRSLRNAKKQHQRVYFELEKQSYQLKFVIIDLNDWEDRAIDLDLEEEVNFLSGYSVFKYCLENGLIEDATFYQKMVDEDRTPRPKNDAPTLSFGELEKPTLGDLFNFKFNE